jgi:type VI secretion system secreted protein VgrG
MANAYKITCSALPDNTRVLGFRGTEGISRLYQFDIYVHVPSDAQDVDMEGAVGAKATLELRIEGGGQPFAFHGIFAAFELINQEGDSAYFHAVLVPQLWHLTQTFQSWIYTKKTIPEIITAVLEDSGLSSSDFSLQLGPGYAVEEHVCQYKESNFDFISRWMEREGMFYFFEQGESSEKLIITDKKSTHAPLADKPVRFHGSFGHDQGAGEALHTFTCKRRALPAGVHLRDHNYGNPSLHVSGKAPVSSTAPPSDITVYGGRFFSPDDAKRLAKVRAEDLLARQVVYHGAGTPVYLRSGYTFKLEEHPRAEFEMEYLAIQLEHVGNDGIKSKELRHLTGIESDQVYWVEVTAIPASTQFRAECSTPWPRIFGFENGTVCGSADSDYAQLDDAGRYNVKFKFDESDLKDGKASTFVRMMQPHGGNPEGFHFPLRKGTEVLFVFLGGDPDRPVISGVVPDAHNPSPVTNKNHTQNVLMTGGKNHMIIEDLEGKQHLQLYSPTQSTEIFMGGPAHHAFSQPPTQKSGGAFTFANVACALYLHTDGSGGLDVGGSWYENVGADYWKFVSGNATIEYVGVHTINVDGDSNEFYNSHQNVKVASGRTDNVDAGGMEQHIHGGLTQTVEPGGKQEVTGGWTHKVSAENHDEYGTWKTDSGKWTANIKGVSWDVKGDITQTATGHITTSSVDSRETWQGNKSSMTYGNSYSVNVGMKASFTLAASFSMEASASLSLFGGIKISAEAALKISATTGFKADFGAATNLRAAPTDVTLGAACTTITGGTMVDVVSPCVFVPAASIVLL